MAAAKSRPPTDDALDAELHALLMAAQAEAPDPEAKKPPGAAPKAPAAPKASGGWGPKSPKR